ncbi:MAG: L-2-amino-thiazoline-4-carboxylic acid hydrolase [Bacteroidota bacterium]
MSVEATDFYTSRIRRLLKDFDSYVRATHPVLLKYFGGDVDGVVAQTRREYAALIPQLPYIGGKQPFTQFLIFTGLWLAVYRTAQANGKSVEETGQMIFEIGRAFLRAYPGFLTSFLGYMNFSGFHIKRLRKRANESQLRMYPGDYVFNFVEGDGQTFDYGVDYLECASCKFLQQQGAAELAPYLCPMDILYSEALGWGLTRTTTLAGGGERCDFRFKKGGPTRVAVPRALECVISGSG